MKKLLLFTVLAMLWANFSNAQCDVKFEDNFETGVLAAGWTTGTNTQTNTITGTGSPQGTYHLSHNNSGSVHRQGLKNTFPSSQITECSYWIKTNDVTSANCYINLGPTGTASASDAIVYSYVVSGNLNFFGTGSSYTTAISNNTWYYIELKNFNWIARTYDIYINNALAQANQPFRSTTATAIAEIFIYSINNTTANYDVIKIGSGPSAPTVAAVPDSICAGEFSKVTAMSSAPTDSIRWYDSMSGGNLLTTTLSGDSLTMTPTDDTTLYAEVYIAGAILADTISFTGAIDSFTVPAGVTSIDIETYGAQGNSNAFNVAGGLGGQANGTLAVTPGQTIYVQVGGGGNNTDSLGGYNGGGQGGATLNCATAFGGGGGGATDVRVSGTTLADRVLVAGGGGGAGGNRVQGCGRGSGGGGGGGYFGGGGGAAWPQSSTVLPNGGSQSGAGTGGTSLYTGAAPGNNGVAGIGAVGGNGGNEIGSNQGGSGNAQAGGAGGGTTGGAGLYVTNFTGQSGSGGSGYTGGVTAGIMNNGIHSGNGMVIFKWNIPPCISSRAMVSVHVDSVPNVTATPSSVTSCYGDTVTLVGGGSDTYSWTGGITNNTPFLPTASSVYTVTGTDASGCSNTATANVILGAGVSNIFADDFETGTLLPHWVNMGSYTTTVISTGSAQGTYNMQNVGSGSHYNGRRATFTPTQITEFSWYVKVPDLTKHSGYMVLGDASITINNGIIFSYFQANNGLRFYGGTATSNYIHTVAANTWYHCECKNFNWTAKTFDLYIDNILVQAGFPFRSTTSTNANQINLYNFSSSSTAFYDDFVVKASTVKLSNATAGNMASTAGTGSGTKMQTTATAREYYDGSCDLIAELSNNASSLGSTVANVTVDAVVPTHNGQPYTARWYEISPTNNNIATDVKFFFTQDDFDDYNAVAGTIWPLLPANPTDAAGIANVRVTKNDNAGLGANPVVLTPSSVTWNAGENRWEVTVNVPSFSQFRVHGANPTNTPLPTNLNSFTVSKLSTSDLVKWTTQSEYNNSRFNVQRSADGVNFETLGTVNTQATNGTSSQELNYSFEDKQPMIGHNYYRLEQVDIDSKTNYSEIIDIVWGSDGSVVTIYPNPTKDILHIDLSTSKVSTVEIKVLDMSGRVVKSIISNTSSGLNNIQLSMNDVAPGVYGVQVFENNKLTHVQKVRKND